MKRCSVDDCPFPAKGRRLCNTHYQAYIRRARKRDGWSEREEQNFWSKVTKTDTCWVWTAFTDKGGYGIFSVNAAPYKAHRFSWRLHKGPIPNGMGVLHRCDNPKCVNPDHLFTGTTTDNMRDKVEKGRQAKGEKHPCVVLTTAQVLEIRRIFVSGSRRYGVRPLARKYGVAKTTMQSVVNGKTWKGVSNVG